MATAAGASSSVGAAVKAAAGDALLTFLWIFCASTLGASTHAIASALDLAAVPAASILITTSLVALLVFVFTFVANALGGASFNPTGTAAFYAAGLGDDGLLSMALRFPAQALGAVGGALAIVKLMPPKYKHMLGGPSVKVDLHTAAIAEGVLTSLISFAVLWIVIRGPRSAIVKTWMIAVATISLVIAGSEFSGPSMNPANKNTSLRWGEICPAMGQSVMLKLPERRWHLAGHMSTIATTHGNSFMFTGFALLLVLSLPLGPSEFFPRHKRRR